MSAFLDLRDVVVGLLTANPALAGGFVKAGRAFPLPVEQAQGIFVRLARGQGQANFAGNGMVDWGTDIVVSMTARATTGQDAETAVDALLDAVYARLAAASPPVSADGWTLAPSVTFDVDEADQALGSAELRLRVQHRTASGDLSAAT